MNRQRLALPATFVVCALLSACVSGVTGDTHMVAGTDDAPAILLDTTVLRRLMSDHDACELTAPSRFGTRILRSGGAVQLSGGRLAVLDWSEPGVVLFDRAGVQVRRIGRSGAGPGEFSKFAIMPPWSGDSISISDQETQRLTVFSDVGTVVRSINLAEVPALGTNAFVYGLARGGRIFALTLPHGRTNVTKREIYRDPGTLKVFGLDRERAQVFRDILGSSFSIGPGGRGWHLRAGFQKSTYIRIADNLVGIADNATTLIDLYRPDGAHVATLDVGVPLPHVTPADVAEYLKRHRENVGETIFAQTREDDRWDSTHVVLAGLDIDADEGVWLKLQNHTYAPWRPWVRVSTSGAIQRCAIQEGDWKTVAVAADEVIFTTEADSGLEVIRQPIGTVRKK